MNILIVNGRVRNLGDRAILTCMMAQMRQAFPGCDIVLEADEPAAMRAYFKDEKVVPAFIEVGAIRSAGRPYSVAYIVANGAFIAKTLATYAYAWLVAVLRLRQSAIPLQNAYRDADLILWAGGDYVSDVYGIRFRFRLFELHLAKLMGKPVVLYSQTVGPFSDDNRRIIGKRLREADRILARDEGTAALLASVGVTDNVRRVADCVLLLDPQRTEHVVTGIRNFSLDTKTVGFVIIDQSFSGVPDSEYDRYLDGMATLVRRTQRTGLKAVLLSATTEDAARAKSFNGRFNLNLPAIDLLAYTSPEAIALIGSLHAVVSSRMHPIIMAVASGVPAFGINKLGKMKDFLGMAGLGDYHQPMAPFNDVEVSARLDLFLANNAELRGVLGENVSALKKLSAEAASQVRETFLEATTGGGNH